MTLSSDDLPRLAIYRDVVLERAGESRLADLLADCERFVRWRAGWADAHAAAMAAFEAAGRAGARSRAFSVARGRCARLIEGPPGRFSANSNARVRRRGLRRLARRHGRCDVHCALEADLDRWVPRARPLGGGPLEWDWQHRLVVVRDGIGRRRRDAAARALVRAVEGLERRIWRVTGQRYERELLRELIGVPLSALTPAVACLSAAWSAGPPQSADGALGVLGRPAVLDRLGARKAAAGLVLALGRHDARIFARLCAAPRNRQLALNLERNLTSTPLPPAAAEAARQAIAALRI